MRELVVNTFLTLDGVMQARRRRRRDRFEVWVPSSQVYDAATGRAKLSAGRPAFDQLGRNSS